MSLSMYQASVPVFQQLLGGLNDVLGKAAAHASARQIEQSALLQSSLFPDMFPLLRQVQIACDFAVGVAARLAGEAVPVFVDDEQSFAALQERIKRALAFIHGLSPACFEGSESREITLRPGTPKERQLDGSAYLLSYGLPQFFFHVGSAYGVLRHSGVEIGKRDYMGVW